MAELAKILIIIGIVLVAAGVLMLFAHKLPLLGKLPGDLIIRKDNFTFYFPLATSIIISIVISLILCIVQKFK